MFNRGTAIPLTLVGTVAWLGLSLWFYTAHSHYADLGALIPITLLGAVILVSVSISLGDGIFNPLAVFSAYYSLFCVSGFYYLHSGFASSYFFSYLNSSDLFQEMERAFWILSLGYISFAIGYFVCVRRMIPISMEFGRYYSDDLIKLVAAVCIAIGVCNFVYIAYSWAGGIPEFLGTIGRRTYQLEAHGGSTLGYRFLEAGIFLMLFRDLRRGRLSAVVVALLLCGLTVRMSTGRITQTMVYVMVCIALIAVRHYEHVTTRKILIGFFAIVLGGVGLYFARFLSSLQSSYMAVSELWPVVKALASPESVSYFIIEKGNLPNLPVFMKVLELWGDKVEFLYGESFLYFLPNLLYDEGRAIAITLKEMVYWGEEGGNLPPTGVGEMYANFGIIGVPIGMFLLGAASAKFFNYIRRRRTYWHWLAYGFVLFGFLFTYPKGESANFGIVVFGVVPPLLVASVVKLASRYLGEDGHDYSVRQYLVAK